MTKKHTILLSAHRDTVMPNYKLSYKNGVYKGLLDNFIGVLVTNSVLISEVNVSELEKEGRIKVFYSTQEEWGMSNDFPILNPDDICIVVDVACGDQYKGVDFALENIWGIDKKMVKDIREHLEWEGFKLKTKVFDGNPDDEDEAWQWKDKGNSVISFIIPIQPGSKDTGWHVCLLYTSDAADE